MLCTDLFSFPHLSLIRCTKYNIVKYLFRRQLFFTFLRCSDSLTIHILYWIYFSWQFVAPFNGSSSTNAKRRKLHRVHSKRSKNIILFPDHLIHYTLHSLFGEYIYRVSEIFQDNRLVSTLFILINFYSLLFLFQNGLWCNNISLLSSLILE